MKKPATLKRRDWLRDWLLRYLIVLPLDGMLRIWRRIYSFRLVSHLRKNSPPTLVNFWALVLFAKSRLYP